MLRAEEKKPSQPLTQSFCGCRTMQLQFLQGSPEAGPAHSQWHLPLLWGGGGCAAEHSFPAAPGQGLGMRAAFWRGWLWHGACGGAPEVAKAVLAGKAPAAQGLGDGAATLLSARVSSQPAQGAPHGAGGRTWGQKGVPWQGRFFSVEVLRAQDCSQLQLTPAHRQSQHFRRDVKAGTTLKMKPFLGSVISAFF